MAVWKACENRAWKGGGKGREKVFEGGLFIVNVTEIAEYDCGRADPKAAPDARETTARTLARTARKRAEFSRYISLIYKIYLI